MATAPATTNTSALSSDYDIEVFFDGGCPLCLREINMLRRWDKRGRIRFSDIDAPELPPSAAGKTYDELMARIQGKLPDGTWVEGVEVFRRLYSAVGFGRIVWCTRLPIIKQILNLGYKIFAKNRLRLTGRCTTDSCGVKKSSPASR